MLLKLSFLVATLLILAVNIKAEEEEDEYSNLLRDLISDDGESPIILPASHEGDRVEHNHHDDSDDDDDDDGPEEADTNIGTGLSKGTWGLQEVQEGDDD